MGTCINVTISGELIDSVLQLKEDGFYAYYSNINKFHLSLFEAAITRTFFINNQGQIIKYRAPGAIAK